MLPFWYSILELKDPLWGLQIFGIHPHILIFSVSSQKPSEKSPAQTCKIFVLIGKPRHFLEFLTYSFITQQPVTPPRDPPSSHQDLGDFFNALLGRPVMRDLPCSAARCATTSRCETMVGWMHLTFQNVVKSSSNIPSLGIYWFPEGYVDASDATSKMFSLVTSYESSSFFSCMWRFSWTGANVFRGLTEQWTVGGMLSVDGGNTCHQWQLWVVEQKVEGGCNWCFCLGTFSQPAILGGKFWLFMNMKLAPLATWTVAVSVWGQSPDVNPTMLTWKVPLGKWLWGGGMMT